MSKSATAKRSKSKSTSKAATVMSAEECLAQLRKEGLVPQDVLRGAMDHVGVLAPIVLDLVEKARGGIFLMPPELRLFLYGVHVVAAAGDQRLCPLLIDIAQMDEDATAPLFRGEAPMLMERLLISVFDGDAGSLFAAIANVEAPDGNRLAMMHALIRLTWEGRIEKSQTAAFLEKFEEGRLAEDDASVWRGWADAVAVLGVVELKSALRRAWKNKEALRGVGRDEQQEALSALSAPQAKGWDKAWFEERNLEAISDPVEGLGPIIDLERLRQQLDEAPELVVDDDPAQEFKLSVDELVWLSEFLVSPKLPGSAMPFEMVDGYFAALAVGPKMLEPADYLPRIWDIESQRKPEFDSPEQEAYVVGLLARHLRTIVARTEADLIYTPFIMPDVDDDDEDEAGSLWAHGFIFAMGQDGGELWQPMASHDQGQFLMLPILMLLQHEELEEILGDACTNETRESAIIVLPQYLREIARFWRDPAGYQGEPASIFLEELGSEFDEEFDEELDEEFDEEIAPREPVTRSGRKIGRNEPCPCGSGKKYKRCCGAG